MNVCIMLLTYAPSIDHPRAQYAEMTLRAALTHIATRSSLKLHIAHDGSDPRHIAHLQEVALDFKSKLTEPTTVTNAERGGYGRSYNLATQAIHPWADYVLPLEDDWVLTKRLDLDALIEAMEDPVDSRLGCVRLGYLGWTHTLKGFVAKFGTQTFLLFDPMSEETHVWAGHPRFESVSFQRRIGAWPEGIDPGSTEFEVSKRTEARIGVAWPLDLSAAASQDWGNLFAHIGEVQARSDQ